LGRKAPSPEKKNAVSEDQEGCGQSGQQTSPDKFEGEENAQENAPCSYGLLSSNSATLKLAFMQT